MDINTCLATTDSVRNLAMYSHLVPALATLVLGTFAFTKTQDRLKGFAFFTFVLIFAAWLVGDFIVWVSNSYQLVATFWAPLDYFEIAFFLSLLFFVFITFFPNKPRWGMCLLILAAVVVPFALTVMGNSLLEFNQPQCEMLENAFLTQYKLICQGVILALILVMSVWSFLRAKVTEERIRAVLVGVSIVLFMGIFAGSEYLSSVTYVYEINLYALFTLPIFVLILTIAITSYGTFRLGDTAVKALFYVFLTLAGSQFFSVTNLTDFLISAMSFGTILIMGIMLFISNEREIKIRHEVERLAHELEQTNTRQETLIHFIGHEVKGFLTKDEGAFAALVDGDFGKLEDGMKPFVESALAQSRDGVRSVTDILTAANQKKGTISYAKESFDLKQLAMDAIEKAKSMAGEKGLTLSFSADEAGAPYTISGDKAKISDNVLRNIIENSIHYTPSGSIAVSLKKENGKIVFAVKDTGVGITEEDKKLLFTEGGHGKESQKINVHSTGYGLYIAKNIVEAHGGTIRAESEGAGKGSTFVVELPAQ